MISVICPIFNEEKYIAKCIDSILVQDYPKENLEMIFIDGMSTDRTRDIVLDYAVRYPFIRLIDNPHRVVPPAMNIGIRASRGDIIIRLDAHAIFPKNYFSELVKNLIGLNADNVGGICNTLPADDRRVCLCIANVLSSSFGMGNSYYRIGAKHIMSVDTVPFGCFHRKIFDQIGYFDEELIRNQDDEFNARIIKNGGKIYLLPNVVFDYYARESIKKTARMFYQYGLFKPLVNKKLGKPATIRQFFPPLFVMGLVLGPLLGIISVYFMIIYLLVVLSYIIIATISSFRQSKNIKNIIIQDYIYFVVHCSYGLGYWVGLYRLLMHKTFNVNTSR